MLKLSHSAVTVYKHCPHAYYLGRVLWIKPFSPIRWPLVVGVAFHNLVNEMYETCDFSYEFLRRNWKKHFTKALDTEASAFQSTAGADEHLQEGYVLIAMFYKFAKENGYLVKPMATEWVFEVLYNGFKIKGIIDLIVKRDDGKIYILDFKTGWAKVSDDQLAVHPQLTLYDWGVLKGMGIKADKVGLFFPRAKAVRLSTRCESDHIQLLNEYTEIATKIQNKDFKPDTTQCKRCDMTSVCPFFKKS